jgi:flavin prenyltransferase
MDGKRRLSVLIESVRSGVLHRHLLSLELSHRERRAELLESRNSPGQSALVREPIRLADRANDKTMFRRRTLAPKSAHPPCGSDLSKGLGACPNSRQQPHVDSGAVAGSEIIVGISGGSGARLAKRFVQVALASKGLSRLHLVISEAGLEVARSELSPAIASVKDWLSDLKASGPVMRRIVSHPNADIGASIASGSSPFTGMIVIPCSGGTLGSIANGVARDLLQRAADVCLKERRPLVLAFRESPYSLVHIENMRRATLAGAIVAPPSPAFYVDSPSVDRFLDAYCVRAARMLGLSPTGEQFRWKSGGSGKAPGSSRRKRR